MRTYLVHTIGYHPRNKNYTPPENLTAIPAERSLLTFDGVYQSVYNNRKLWSYWFWLRRPILFVTGNYVGGDNSFEAENKQIDEWMFERYCTWDEIIEMKNVVDIGWHTWSHRDLTQLSLDEIVREITPPFPMKYFAYPYGRFNDKVLQAVEAAGYKEAFGVADGDDTRFQRTRIQI